MTDELRGRLQHTLGAAYSIERELGGGGMSRVFVAKEIGLDRDVVVKVLPPEVANELSAERFRREIQLAARLQHPHIVPVLAAGTAGASASGTELLYYTMPLIEGETLRARLTREGELPVNAVTRVARDLADALSYAHERNVVHRDLKPENVLLTRGHALVADFGVAKAVSASVKDGSAAVNALTSIGLALGTPAYMAPEQAAADPSTDHRADIYALGCVTYELLAGTPPFFGRPAQALLAAHAAEAPEHVSRRRPTTPPALAALVMHMLEKRPADRPQTADEILAAIEAMTTASTPMTTVGSQPVPGVAATTATAPTIASPVRPRTAWRAGLIGGAAAGVALVVALAMFAGGKRSGSTANTAAPTVAVRAFDARGDARLESTAAVVSEYLRDALSADATVRLIDGGNARFAIAGSLEPAGADSATVRARLIDDTGRTLRVFTPIRIATADASTSMEPLSSRVRGAIGMVAHSMLGPAALPRNDAPTVEAFAEFDNALTVLDRLLAGVGNIDEFGQRVARAASLDTTFHQARLWGLWVQGNRLSLRATVDSVLTAFVSQHGDQLSEYERALASWMRAQTRSDGSSLVREGERLYTLAPSPWTKQVYGRALIEVGRVRAGFAVLDSLRGAALADVPEFWAYLTTALHILGDHRRELALAREARRAMPDRRGVRSFEIRALVALDSVNEAIRATEEASSLPVERDAAGTGGVAATHLYLPLSAELRGHGHDAASERIDQRIRELAPTVEADRLTLTQRRGFVQALIYARDTSALREARALARVDTTTFNGLYLLGVAAAASGQTAEAERAMAAIRARGAAQGEFSRGAELAALSRVAAALGRDAEALRLLAAAFANGQGHALRRTVHTSREFERLWNHPDLLRITRARDG